MPSSSKSSRTPAPRPTEGELAILQVLWEHGPLPVRRVQQILTQRKPTGYTTVLKLMQIMHEKGLVARDESVRPQIYRARDAQQKTQQQLVRDLVTRAFAGSTRAMVMQALAAETSSPEELEQIERLLERMEQERRNPKSEEAS